MYTGHSMDGKLKTGYHVNADGDSDGVGYAGQKDEKDMYAAGGDKDLYSASGGYNSGAGGKDDENEYTANMAKEEEDDKKKEDDALADSIEEEEKKQNPQEEQTDDTGFKSLSQELTPQRAMQQSQVPRGGKKKAKGIEDAISKAIKQEKDTVYVD